MKKVAIPIVIAVAVVLVVGFAPIMDVPYQEIETYYEDEPYGEIVETPVPLKYQRISCGGTVCEIMNRDKVGGNFSFRLTFYSIDQNAYLGVLWESNKGLR